jgi:hypothetical protein
MADGGSVPRQSKSAAANTTHREAYAAGNQNPRGKFTTIGAAQNRALKCSPPTVLVARGSSSLRRRRWLGFGSPGQASAAPNKPAARSPMLDAAGGAAGRSGGNVDGVRRGRSTSTRRGPSPLSPDDGDDEEELARVKSSAGGGGGYAGGGRPSRNGGSGGEGCGASWLVGGLVARRRLVSSSQSRADGRGGGRNPGRVPLPSREIRSVARSSDGRGCGGVRGLALRAVLLRVPRLHGLEAASFLGFSFPLFF